MPRSAHAVQRLLPVSWSRPGHLRLRARQASQLALYLRVGFFLLLLLLGMLDLGERLLDSGFVGGLIAFLLLSVLSDPGACEGVPCSRLGAASRGEVAGMMDVEP